MTLANCRLQEHKLPFLHDQLDNVHIVAEYHSVGVACIGNEKFEQPASKERIIALGDGGGTPGQQRHAKISDVVVDALAIGLVKRQNQLDERPESRVSIKSNIVQKQKEQAGTIPCSTPETQSGD